MPAIQIVATQLVLAMENYMGQECRKGHGLLV